MAHARQRMLELPSETPGLAGEERRACRANLGRLPGPVAQREWRRRESLGCEDSDSRRGLFDHVRKSIASGEPRPLCDRPQRRGCLCVYLSWAAIRASADALAKRQLGPVAGACADARFPRQPE